MPAHPSRQSKIAKWWSFIRQPRAERYKKVVFNPPFLLTLIALIIFTNWLGERWIFRSGSLVGSDVLVRAAKPVAAEHCRLILVNQEDFTKYFGETLEPAKLADVLTAILKYQPKVLVVDIDTSASRFRNLENKIGKHPASTIVWARVSNEELKSDPREIDRVYDWSNGGVLGGDSSSVDNSGSPLFPLDPDSTVRGFQRTVVLKNRDQKDREIPALHWVALKAYCKSGGNFCSLVDHPDSADQAVRPFDGNWDFVSFPLSDLMKESGLKVQPGQLGDIVILGASFSDIHTTSFGPKLGIELTASAIETEILESSKWQFLGWPLAVMHWGGKIILGFLIALLNSKLKPLWALLGISLLVALVFLVSFAAYYSLHFQIEFLPFMIGIWIEQLVQGAERAQHAH